MATPADQRLLELLDKWLKSLELHQKYSTLDDESYSQIQPWPDHQRPSRWIIDLAKQKAAALQSQIQDRIERGDSTFSDSLELMTFLANLVGAEHIERFIPLAKPDTERSQALTAVDEEPPMSPGDAATATREMPKFSGLVPRAPAPSGTNHVARTERKADVEAVAKAPPKPPANPAAPNTQAAPVPGPASPSKPSDRAAKSDRPISSEAMLEQVIADAVRLVQWGRKWYELAELISSMADRPPLTDVRRMLKDNKTVIDKKAGRG